MTTSLIGNPFYCMKDQLGGVKPSWDWSRCHVNYLFPPTPRIFNCMIYRESYIQILSPEEQFLSTQVVTRPCDILVLSTSSSSSSATSSPFFISPWERVSWPFFRLSLCMFSGKSLGFLELFPTLPLSIFGHCYRGLASRMAIMSNICSEWTQAWWPPLN